VLDRKSLSVGEAMARGLLKVFSELESTEMGGFIDSNCTELLIYPYASNLIVRPF
jgi:hypothetical protein